MNVIEFVKPWWMLSFAFRWLGKNKTYAYSLPDMRGYKQDRSNDKELSRKLWELMGESEVLVAHNGDAYDQKMAYARFLKHGFTPPSPSQTVDTLKVARKNFKIPSNKLDDLGQYLGVGRKEKHHGFATWIGCMDGDPRSWDEMVRYNKRDVELLERVYLKLKPYMNNHPNANVYNDTFANCPNCGQDSLIRSGWRVNRTGRHQRFHCTHCGAWSMSPRDTSVVR